MSEVVDISGMDSYQARRILEEMLRKRGEYGFEPQKCDHCGHNAHCADAAPAIALDGIAQLISAGPFGGVIALGRDGRAYLLEEKQKPASSNPYITEPQWTPLPRLPQRKASNQ